MKKDIFQDLVIETRFPFSLFKFFLFSVVVHVFFAVVFLSLDLEPSRVNSQIKEPPKVLKPIITNQSPVDITSKFRPSTATGQNHAGFAGNSRYTTTKTAEPDYLGWENRTSKKKDFFEPAPSPGMVYRYTMPRRLNGNITGDPHVQLYNKPFLDVGKKPFSAFPIIQRSVESYRRVKHYIDQHKLPPQELIKIEELIDYFDYDYPQPQDGQPFSITTEVNNCPWQSGNLLLHIGLQGKIEESTPRLKMRDFVIASNLKIKVDFNQMHIKAFRLIGYALQKPVPGRLTVDWDEKKDLRMGQRVTTLYELIPARPTPTLKLPEKEMAKITIDFLDPEDRTGQTRQIKHQIFPPVNDGNEESADFKFSAVVAQFGMMLKNPDFKGTTTLLELLQSAKDALGEDQNGYRAGFITLLETYQRMLEEKK